MNIQIDKLMHFAAGSIAAILGIMFVKLAGFAEWAFVAGLSTCILAAVGREIYNRQHGGPFDWYDIVAAMLGAVPPLIAVAVVQYGL